MPHRRLTRRQVLRTGATALAVGVLPARATFAASRPGLFELAIDEGDGAVAAGWRTSRVLRAPRRFDLLGLRWSGGHVDAQVRARKRGGSWGEWLPLHAMGEHGPDGEAPLLGTEPAFTGPADHLQLRLRGRARGLRARFVAAEPPPRVAAARRARTAQVGKPRIITRAEWGGDAYPPRVAPEYGAVQLAFVHHTVTTNDYGPEQSAGIVRSITAFHRNSNGWNDVGYNFLVDKHGQVFEGRAGGIDQAVIGAQAQGFNAQSTGIAFLAGQQGSIPAPDVTLTAIARLIGWKLSRHGVPVSGQVSVISAGGETNRHRSGTAVAFNRVSGHRDANNTTCPGNPLYAQLPDLRSRAARYAGPVGGISMRADSGAVVRHPRPLVLTGWLRHDDGATRADEAVSVEFATAGGGWTPLETARTDGTGSWRAEVTLPDSGIVRVTHARDGLVSPLLSVRVIPRLTLVPSARRVPAGALFPITGEFAPQLAPRKAAVLVELKTKSGYKKSQSRTVTVRDGRYGFRLRLRKPGLYRVSVTIGGATIRRTVRAVSAGAG